MPPKRPISIDERRALRRWSHRQSPKPSHKQCIQWFFEQFGHRLSQSSDSESLSNTYSNLDDPANKITTTLRVRNGNWPELESLLRQWQLKIESRGGCTTGDILQEKAKQIWRQLPQSADKPVPEFSARWLENFKKRHHIKQRVQHGEAGSVADLAREEMKALQTIAGEYEEDNVYNMDETGLFWRMLPTRGLLSQSIPGAKKDKARVSIVLCTNATGTDRLPVWIIGKARTPRALKNVCISSMGGRWRWNTKAWMNTIVMCEWLQEFYSHIGTRKVLLTMDNFSAHYSAIEISPPPPNIRICWLPANSTSRFQPLDQGIIQNFKAFYKRQWLQLALESYEMDLDPLARIDIRIAIRWIVRCWNAEVTNTTIYNCFRKSTLILNPISLPTLILPNDIAGIYDRVIEAGQIHDAMAMSNFLNPLEEDKEEEVIEASEDDILQEVINEHLGVQGTSEDEEESEQIQNQYSLKDALQAIQVLIECAETTEILPSKYIRSFKVLKLCSRVFRYNQESRELWILGLDSSLHNTSCLYDNASRTI